MSLFDLLNPASWVASAVTAVGGKVADTVLGWHKDSLDAANQADRIKADLASRELAVEQRESELATQVIIAEEGRWWTALPRALVCYSGAIYVCKVVVFDTVLGLGSTPALKGDVATWVGWLMAMWFAGRSAEKVARIWAKK